MGFDVSQLNLKSSGTAEPSSSSSSDARPPPKKLKVHIEHRRPLARGDACNACRSRKVRCPGQRPICANCSKRSRECVYSEKRYMLSMLDEDEEEAAPARAPITPATAPTVSPGFASSSASSSHHHSNSTSTGTSTNMPSIASSAGPAPIPLLTPLSSGLSPLAPMSISPASMASIPLIPGQPFLDDMDSFMAFLPILGGSPDGLVGQTLPAQYADLDLDQLLRELERDIAAAAEATAVTQPVPPLAVAQPPQPAALTALEREHLLWIYFNNQVRFALEMHFATFWERLNSPEPKEQPHPALLNAIYLVTCWASPAPHLRNREQEFFQTAREEMTVAVSKSDRLLDAARAAFLLSCWCYSKTRFPEAGSIGATAVSIAIMCGLHIIPSSRFVEQTKDFRRGLLRNQFVYLCNPRSQMELAERISTFWSIFLLDRCAAIAQDWPSGLGDDRVCTPLPRPWSDYENPGPHLDEDETLYDVLEGRKPRIQSSERAQLLKGLEILYRSSLLGVNMARLCPSAESFNAVWGRGERAQREKAMLEHALEVYIDRLPASLKTVQSTRTGKSITNMTGTLQFMIGGSQMFLHDTDRFHDTNEVALAAARRMLGVIHLLGDQNDAFDSGLLVVMIWSKLGNLLIRESLRLEDLGDSFGAAKVDAELNAVIRALKIRGQTIRLSMLQARGLEEYRRNPERHNPGCRAGSVTGAPKEEPAGPREEGRSRRPDDRAPHPSS